MIGITCAHPLSSHPYRKIPFDFFHIHLLFHPCIEWMCSITIYINPQFTQYTQLKHTHCQFTQATLV